MNYSNEQDGYKMTDELKKDLATVANPLVRYGIQWNGPLEPICTPMADGLWTTWHEADAHIRSLQSELDRLRQQPPAGEIYLDDFGQQCVELYDDAHKPGDKIYTAPSAGGVQNDEPHEKALRELDDWLLEAIRCADTIFGVNTPEGALQAARTALRDICNDHGVKL